MIAALAIGWALAVAFAVTALVCALVAGDRGWERDRAREERNEAVAEVLDLKRRISVVVSALETTQEIATPQQLLADADHMAGMTDFTEAEVDARIADLEALFRDSAPGKDEYR